MGILRRRVRPPEAIPKDAGTESTVRERIEVTVEREWITMLVRDSPETADDGSSSPHGHREKPIIEGTAEESAATGELGKGD